MCIIFFQFCSYFKEQPITLRLVIHEKNEKLIVKKFKFSAQCTMVEFEENGEVRVFKDEVEVTESNLNYVYQEFYKEPTRYVKYEGDKPILFDHISKDPILESIGKEKILEKSLHYCNKAYRSNETTHGFFSIGTDTTKKIDKDSEKEYSTKVFWANETSDKNIYIAFRGTVDDKKPEFVEDWMTNLDFNLIEDVDSEPGKFFKYFQKFKVIYSGIFLKL